MTPKTSAWRIGSQVIGFTLLYVGALLLVTKSRSEALDKLAEKMGHAKPSMPMFGSGNAIIGDLSMGQQLMSINQKIRELNETADDATRVGIGVFSRFFGAEQYLTYVVLIVCLS